MKTKIFVVLLSFSSALVYAQGFASKTNSIAIDYTQPITATTLPQISWITPRIESSMSSEESMVLEATVTSDLPLKEIKMVIHNGGVASEKLITIEENSKITHVNQPLILAIGGNYVIKLIAENNKGGIVSSTRAVMVGKDELADAVDANRKDYALIFATDRYENYDELPNPVHDARTIETILKDKYGFITEVVENSTLDEMSDKLYDYNTRKFNPQDQLFVFFAGHGYYDEVLGEGYVVASNSVMNDKGKNSYLAHQILRQRLENIKCEHIFLTMDVCFGGTFDPVLAKNRASEADENADKQYLVKKLTKRTRKYLTSGGKQYVPDGVAGKHSPFAAKFIQALREIGGGTGRLLTLHELNTYFQNLPTEPRYGSFGTDDPASDFVFVSKN